MIEVHGPHFGGIHPIPSDEELKKMRLKNIKTKAGKIAHLLVLGKQAAVSGIKQGISHAEGALKWVGEKVKEKLEGET